MSSKKQRVSRLGRGLSALMAQPVQVQPSSTPPEAANETDEAQAPPSAPPADHHGKKPAPRSARHAAPAGQRDADADPSSDSGLRYVPVAAIRPNPHQPRQRFDEDSLRKLADSIRADGLMQPVILRPVPADRPQEEGIQYELVAGERRWRAAHLADLATIPAIVRELDDRQLAEWALIENLQREDLDPIERAQAFQHLVERLGLSHDEIAQRVGLDRSTVSNLLRLLSLDESVQQLIREGLLSMGQARAIVSLTDPDQQRRLAKQAVQQGLSVRQVEQLVRSAQNGSPAPGASTADAVSQRRVRSAYLADLEQQITHQLQTKVHIRPGRKKGSGTLTIEFYSLDQFDALLERLGVQTE